MTAFAAKRLLPRRIRRRVERYINLQKFGSGYLEDKGWFRGAASCQALDAVGEPIPWITYPALEALNRSVDSSQKVFEYGGGNSSLWWSKKVEITVSVEHDRDWANLIRSKADSGLTVILRERGDDYAVRHDHAAIRFLDAHPDLPSYGDPSLDLIHGLNCLEFISYASEPLKFGKGYFDIIVVDGMARSLCAVIAADCIADDGIIVFDNSERSQYNPGFIELGKRGWKRIDFYGPGPITNFEWCTSIFCRNLNWLKSSTVIPGDQRPALG